MSRVLVLGAGGMLGHMCRIYLSEVGHEVRAIARSCSDDWDSLDVADNNKLFSYIDATKPEFIINCVGVLIKESEKDPERAIRINALLPQVLAKNAANFGFSLIHLSSDCVFSGSAGPYKERDKKDADSIYGITKSLGEVADNCALTIRTSIVGPELHKNGTGLFNWFMSQTGSIRGFGHSLWGGVTTLETAKAIDYLIANPLSGLLHLTNGLAISKYDLLCLFAEIWGRSEVYIQRDDSIFSNKSLLSNRRDFTYNVPGYREMLVEMKLFMDQHSYLYNIYD